MWDTSKREKFHFGSQFWKSGPLPVGLVASGLQRQHISGRNFMARKQKKKRAESHCSLWGTLPKWPKDLLLAPLCNRATRAYKGCSRSKLWHGSRKLKKSNHLHSRELIPWCSNKKVEIQLWYLDTGLWEVLWTDKVINGPHIQISVALSEEKAHTHTCFLSHHLIPFPSLGLCQQAGYYQIQPTATSPNEPLSL